MCILQHKEIDKLILNKKNSTYCNKVVYCMTFFMYYNKTFEAVYYCHKVICCNNDVIASTYLL